MSRSRIALVTGGSRGIGYRLCRELAGQGTFVNVHAATPVEAHATVDRLIRDGVDPELLYPVSADFRRLDDVFSMARHLRPVQGSLDLLVNNAGALAPPGLTDDGIDATFQITYVAPYALTRLLAPALNATAGRIVTVTSALHRDARLTLDRPDAVAARPVDAYAEAHLALVLFTRVVARTSERRVTAVAVHPGVVDTGSFTQVFGAGGLPVDDGVAHVAHAADPTTEAANGGYYEGLLLAQPAWQACDDDAAQRLWVATARLLGWDYTAVRVTSGRCTSSSVPASRPGNIGLDIGARIVPSAAGLSGVHALTTCPLRPSAGLLQHAVGSRVALRADAAASTGSTGWVMHGLLSPARSS